MRYAASNYMGQTPARSYQDEKLICVNLDAFFSIAPEIRRFIVLHELGHIINDTDDEIEADNYAFSKMSGTYKGSNLASVLALSRVLPFSSKEQYLRLLNMYENALQKQLPRENYELTGDQAYEFDYVRRVKADAEQMPDAMFQQPEKATGVAVGPLADIAQSVWLKKALGLELSAYDLTILDKFPIPADFEAYELNGDEILGDAEKAAPTADQKEIGKQVNQYLLSALDHGNKSAGTSAQKSYKINWLWVAVGLVAIVFISRKIF